MIKLVRLFDYFETSLLLNFTMMMKWTLFKVGLDQMGLFTSRYLADSNWFRTEFKCSDS